MSGQFHEQKLRHYKIRKLGHFSRYLLEIVHTYTPIRFFHIYSVFENLKIFFIFLKKDIFYYFFPKFKQMKIRDSGLIDKFIRYLLLKTNPFYLLSCLGDSVPCKPLFLPRNGKTWRHSDGIYGWLIKASEFSFCQDVPNWWLVEY